MENDVEAYHYRISLRVFHPSISPQEVTRLIGIEPQRAWQAGTPRRTPAGAPLEGIYKESFWYTPLVGGRWPDRTLDSAIAYLLTDLVSRRAVFQLFRKEGGRVELFIGWFFERQSGDVLSYKTLALAGDLGIDLSFDVYPPSQPQHEYAIPDKLTGRSPAPDVHS